MSARAVLQTDVGAVLATGLLRLAHRIADGQAAFERWRTKRLWAAIAKHTRRELRALRLRHSRLPKPAWIFRQDFPS